MVKKLCDDDGPRNDIFSLFRDRDKDRPTTARCRRTKVTRGQKALIIEALRKAFPNPLSGRQLGELGIKNVNGRVHDLKKDGYPIRGDGDLPLSDDGTQLYALRTLAEPEPEPATAAALRVVIREDGHLIVSGYAEVTDEKLQARLVEGCKTVAVGLVGSVSVGGAR